MFSLFLKNLQTLKAFVIQKFICPKDIYFNNKVKKKHEQHWYQYVGEIGHTHKRSI